MAVRAANGSRAANHVSRPANSARIAAQARPKAINRNRDRGWSSPRNTGSQLFDADALGHHADEAVGAGAAGTAAAPDAILQILDACALLRTVRQVDHA